MPLTLRAKKGSRLTMDEADGLSAEKVTQASHGFAAGDLIYRQNATTWAKAIATASSTLADGVVAYVEDTSTFWVVTSDGTIVQLASHGIAAAGTLIWLSQSVAGGYATGDAPYSTGQLQLVGRVMDDDEILFRIGFVGMEV